MIFYLGTHQPHWLARAAVPLFVSARRLRGRKSLPRALGPWALDSGGFSELKLFGTWTVTARQYAAEVRRWRDEIGNLEWAAPQDWMCEPFMVAKTGFTVAQHQQFTVNNFLALNALDGELPWVPVLQGWELRDYLEHFETYRRAGVRLQNFPLVGLGSVCRRQGTREVARLVRVLAVEYGLTLHGFGFKTLGLTRKVKKNPPTSALLASSDSMAWSYAARRSPPMAGHTHKSCANCVAFALRWRESLVRRVDAACRSYQTVLW